MFQGQKQFVISGIWISVWQTCPCARRRADVDPIDFDFDLQVEWKQSWEEVDLHKNVGIQKEIFKDGFNWKRVGFNLIQFQKRVSEKETV